MKGSSSSGQSGSDASAASSTTAKLVSTFSLSAWTMASAAIPGEVVLLSPTTSSTGRHRTAPGEVVPMSPVRTMTPRRGKLLDRTRTAEVSSSSMSAQEALLLCPKKDPTLKPPFPSCAPTWLRSTTLVISFGAPCRRLLRPAFAAFTAPSLRSSVLGHTIATSQPASFFSRSSKFSVGITFRDSEVASPDSWSRARISPATPPSSKPTTATLGPLAPGAMAGSSMATALKSSAAAPLSD
mmetsp:Transcript_9539/g.21248  ORF Transcript_9539/g.21248 Transcript_9539/m.21248 type:complete len:240 (-) Transcript_9539:467-1186(-)